MEPKSARERRFDVPEHLYPFASHWFEREGSAMHYLDEGEGPAVVLLHGNPTWSFLYRDVIAGLRDSFRCIAPDYPGFGLSDHPPGYGYTPQEHADWVGALLSSLDLEEFILVVQDWGGPIGMSLAVEMPEKIRGLVVLNTWVWRPPLAGRVFSWLMGGPLLGRRLQLQRNFFAEKIVPSGIFRKERRTAEILKAYTDPFPDEASRMGTWVFPWAIRNSDTWLSAIEHRLYRLRDKPMDLVWAMKDKAFGSEAFIRKWQKYFPHAFVTRCAEASHYLQEDVPEEIVAAVRRVSQRADAAR